MMKRKLVFSLVICCMCLAGSAVAKMRSVNKVRAGVPPYEIIKKILVANNQSLKQGINLKRSDLAPYLTWLTDPDSRISPNLILQESGQVYAVRNFGNQLELAAGAVDYGVRQLLTPILMITANSDNEAVRLFMDGYGDVSPALRQNLDHLYLALVHDNLKLQYKVRLRNNVEANVDYQVALALARYHDRVATGRLVVLGSVLDFDNVYKHGPGRLVIININGERDSAKLKKTPMLKFVGRKFVNLCIGRGPRGKKHRGSVSDIKKIPPKR